MQELGWQPGIGDPSLLGWLTVFGYFAAALLAYRSSRRLRLVRNPANVQVRERLLWTLLAVGFVVLGFNKQLDLQTGFAELGKSMALEQGWYEHRRVVQLVFIVALCVVSALVAGAVLALARGTSRRLRMTVLGTCVLLSFIVVRAASLHHIDELLGTQIADIRLHRLLELAGLLVVLAATRSPRVASTDVDQRGRQGAAKRRGRQG